MGIDEIDCMIIDLIQKEPSLTHSQIAEKVSRSQPTIGMRIKKLEKLGVLKYQAGITLKNSDLLVARVDIQSNKPQEMLKTIEKCPFLLNGFLLSGNMNISILVAGATLKDLERIINYHFRKDSEVLKITTEIITGIAVDLIIPLNLHSEREKNCSICNETEN